MQNNGVSIKERPEQHLVVNVHVPPHLLVIMAVTTEPLTDTTSTTVCSTARNFRIVSGVPSLDFCPILADCW